MEYAPNSSVLEYMQFYQKSGLEEKWVRHWFRQILAGLQHIHSNGCCHLNIKCENILLDKDLNIKIAGFSKAKLKKQFFRKNCDSDFYLAPEFTKLEFNFDGEKLDVFALAIVLFVCKMNKFPNFE